MSLTYSTTSQLNRISNPSNNDLFEISQRIAANRYQSKAITFEDLYAAVGGSAGSGSGSGDNLELIYATITAYNGDATALEEYRGAEISGELNTDFSESYQYTISSFEGSTDLETSKINAIFIETQISLGQATSDSQYYKIEAKFPDGNWHIINAADYTEPTYDGKTYLVDRSNSDCYQTLTAVIPINRDSQTNLDLRISFWTQNYYNAGSNPAWGRFKILGAWQSTPSYQVADSQFIPTPTYDSGVAYITQTGATNTSKEFTISTFDADTGYSINQELVRGVYIKCVGSVNASTALVQATYPDGASGPTYTDIFKVDGNGSGAEEFTQIQFVPIDADQTTFTLKVTGGDSNSTTTATVIGLQQLKASEDIPVSVSITGGGSTQNVYDVEFCYLSSNGLMVSVNDSLYNLLDDELDKTVARNGEKSGYNFIDASTNSLYDGGLYDETGGVALTSVVDNILSLSDVDISSTPSFASIATLFNTYLTFNANSTRTIIDVKPSDDLDDDKCPYGLRYKIIIDWDNSKVYGNSYHRNKKYTTTTTGSDFIYAPEILTAYGSLDSVLSFSLPSYHSYLYDNYPMIEVDSATKSITKFPIFLHLNHRYSATDYEHMGFGKYHLRITDIIS